MIPRHLCMFWVRHGLFEEGPLAVRGCLKNWACTLMWDVGEEMEKLSGLEKKQPQKEGTGLHTLKMSSQTVSHGVPSIAIFCRLQCAHHEIGETRKNYGKTTCSVGKDQETCWFVELCSNLHESVQSQRHSRYQLNLPNPIHLDNAGLVKDFCVHVHGRAH